MGTSTYESRKKSEVKFEGRFFENAISARRPFLFHYRSTLLSQSLLRMISIFASRGNYLCFARVMNPRKDGWVQKTARTCPTRMRESFTLTNLIWLVRAFLKSCGSHIYSGLVTTRTKQVRFKCLSTPRRGPNNKPLAFVVPGAHSYELGGFFTCRVAGWPLM